MFSYLTGDFYYTHEISPVFKSPYIMEDNLFRSLKMMNKTIVKFGNSMWDELYPNYFSYSSNLDYDKLEYAYVSNDSSVWDFLLIHDE